MPVRLLVPSECAAKLFDEAALSEEAKAELNRFMVADPTKTLLRCFPIMREHNEFVLSGECELASITLGDAISVNAHKQPLNNNKHSTFFHNNMQNNCAMSWYYFTNRTHMKNTHNQWSYLEYH